MNSFPKEVKVGYVLKVFPRLSETFILNEILELERQGVNIEIFSLKPSIETRYHSQLAQLNAQIHYLHRKGSTARHWKRLQSQFDYLDLNPGNAGLAFIETLRSGELLYLLQAISLVAEVRRRKIDHLHAHFATSATWVALLTHFLCGVSFSFTAHAKDLYHRDADHSLLAQALESASFAITVTDHNVKHLQKTASPAQHKLHRVYNGIRLEGKSPLPTLVTEPPLVLGVGRLVEKKGFRYLIEACQILRSRGRAFRCVIVGGGEEEGNLSALIAENQLQDCCTLRGPQAQEVVMDYMAKARMLVLPCVVAADGNRDALPTVMLEAMALGRPIVSTTLPGVTEIVEDGKNGLLVSQGDSKALAVAIERILTEPQSGLEMGHEGRKKAERLFSLEKNVASIASLFERSVSEDHRQMADGRAGST